MSNSREKKIKLKEAFDKVSQTEREFDFFNFSLRGIPLWIYPRERAIFAISGMIQESAQFVSHQKINFLKFFQRAFSFLLNFSKLFGNEIIIFTNERHLEWSSKEKKYYNPFVELILEKDRFHKALIFEFPTPMTDNYQKVKYEKYLPLDFILALKQIFIFSCWLWYPKIKREFTQKLLQANLWQKPEIKKILRFTACSAYNIKFYAFFLNFLRLLNPKVKLIYSCQGGYDKFPEVIEIQHGVILDFHPQYIFPNTAGIKKYLRKKKTIVFSQRVKELLSHNGYLSENIKVTSNPKVRFYFLRNLKRDFWKQDLKPNKILIISDWGGNLQEILKRIVLDLEKNKARFKNWEISLILHPTEKNIYKSLNLSKVKVFENHKVSLWELLCQSLCILSISSTVLEEAIYFGCFEIVLKDKEFEDQKKYLKWLCQDYPFKVIIEPEKFIEWFQENEKKLVNHLPVKKRIIADYYEKFLKQDL